MSGYVIVHEIGDRTILVYTKKNRVYAKLHGSLSEGLFRYGQSALDAVFAIFAVMEPRYIDYILDVRFSKALPDEVFKLWQEKALELGSKYPQANMVVVTDRDSPLWLQISESKGLFELHGNRMLGVFQNQEEAEAFFDKLRGFSD